MSHDATLRSWVAPWLLATATAGIVIAACRTAPANAPSGTAPSSLPSRTSLAPPSVRSPAVRVGILVEGVRTSIAADSGVDVWLSRDGDPAPERLHLPRATFETAPGGRVSLVETRALAARALVAPSVSSELLASQAQTYRGLIEVRPAAGATLTVVNVVNVEDYVRGVVPNELSSGALRPARGAEGAGRGGPNLRPGPPRGLLVEGLRPVRDTELPGLQGSRLRAPAERPSRRRNPRRAGHVARPAHPGLLHVGLRRAHGERARGLRRRRSLPPRRRVRSRRPGGEVVRRKRARGARGCVGGAPDSGRRALHGGEVRQPLARSSTSCRSEAVSRAAWWCSRSWARTARCC